MSQNKKSWARGKIILLSAVIAAATVFTPLAPIASAAVVDNANNGASTNLFNSLDLTTQAKVWVGLQLLQWGKCTLVAHNTVDNLNKGNLFNATNATPTGYWYGDGNVDCNNGDGWFSDLIKAAGFTDVAQLYNPYYQLSTQQVSDYPANTWVLRGPSDSDTAALADTIAHKLFDPTATAKGGGFIKTNLAPTYLEYEMIMNTFVNKSACAAQPAPAVGTSEYNTLLGQNYKPIKIYIFDGTNVTQADYMWQDNSDHPVGLGTEIDGGANGDGSLQCSTIAQHLKQDNSLATAMQRWVNAGHTFTPPGDTSGAASQTVPDCEESGWTLGWIACPIIYAVGHSVDFIFSNIVQPLLRTDPINITGNGNDNSSKIYAIWSQFRVYGDIFLVLAMLIIVFGQSIGGGIVDAYTAKKVLPRILVSAILINLSIYIVALMIDITNIIGDGLSTLITRPFTQAHAFSLGVDSSGGLALGITTLIGSAGVGAAIWATATGAILEFLPGILLFVLIPALLIALSIMMTILLRRGLIIFLILISPVAFALYCLPNTEKYFKQWWETLFKTLLVYPIIAVLFAIANVLSVTIVDSTNNWKFSWLATIMGIAAMLVPLFLIPFAFRIAGGFLGKAYETFTNYHKRGQEAVKGNPNDPASWRNIARGRATGQINRTRAQGYRSWRKTGRLNGLNAFLLGGAIEKEAMLNKASKQRIGDIKDNGDDSIVNARASFLDYSDLHTSGRKRGQPKRKTLDGKEVKDADWSAAQKLYPNLSDVQAVADYRSTKINSTQEAHQFLDNYGKMSKQMGLTADETTGVFTGLAFARQTERGEFKYGKYVDNGGAGYEFLAAGAPGAFAGDVVDGKTVSVGDSRAANKVKEAYTKKGAWDASRAFGSYYTNMGDIKEHHFSKLEGYNAKVAGGGTLTADEGKLRDHSRDEIKKIMEMEDAWTKGGMYRDPDTGKMVESGLSGASAETIAAFNKMKAIGDYTKRSDPSAPIAIGSRYHEAGLIRNQIDTGETYDATHTPIPGDFTDKKTRPYLP